MGRSVKTLIVRSFYRLLGGIVRLGIRNGVSYKEFAAISKQLYVKISSEEYGLQGRPTNMARIALMTGLDRKEIKKIIEQMDEHHDIATGPDRMSKILTVWHEDPMYIDGNKQPKAIPIAGAAPSFEHLVKSCGGDIAVVTVLREFKRSQTISENTADDRVTVHKRYYVPNYQGDSERSPELVNPEAIAQGSSMLTDHINTIFYNLYRDDFGLREKIDLRATNACVRKTAVKEFYQLVDRKGMEFLQDIDQWLSQNEVSTPTEESERLGIGLYFIEGQNDSLADKSDEV